MMILQTGWLKPTVAQVKIAKKQGDSSFTSSMNVDDFPIFAKELIPLSNLIHDNWDDYIRTLIFLKMKNVEPHTDSYVGYREQEEHSVFASLFWVLASRKPLHLHAGPHSAELRTGSWVLFADTVMHSVISDSTWVGCATQVNIKIPYEQGKIIGTLGDLSANKTLR